MREQIARNLYQISAAGRYGGRFPEWEELRLDQQEFFREKADTLVLHPIKEEIEKSLLTDEGIRAVVASYFEIYDEPDYLGIVVGMAAQAQLDKVLKALEE